MCNDPRGSVWRKWDLHVHTPASHNYKGTYEQTIEQIARSECTVVGICDYCTVDGYKEIVGRGGYGDKTLLPVVEFRMNNEIVSRTGKKSGERINFHIIFDPAVGLDEMKTFVGSIACADAKGGERQLGPLSKEERFGATVDFGVVLAELARLTPFVNRYCVWLPYDEYGGIDRIDPANMNAFKLSLITRANCLGSANANTTQFFLWRDEKYAETQYREWFGRRMGCIKGSDSHDHKFALGHLCDSDSQPTDKFCWIKADPTFAGLQQALLEPEDRVWIGGTPAALDMLTRQSHRFLQGVEIRKVDGSHLSDLWFDCDIPLNSGLVVIIGNKGSGKSALADVIALAGNHHGDFSFLTREKFREPKGKLADQFWVQLNWAREGGASGKRALNQDPEVTSVEYVKYIPQEEIERLCSRAGTAGQQAFQHELEGVIFARIPDAQKLGCASLSELVEQLTSETERAIQGIRRELAGLNKAIAQAEKRLTPGYTEALNQAFEAKRVELQAHDEAKPEEVADPAQTKTKPKEAELTPTDGVADILAQLEGINTTIAADEQRLRDAMKTAAALKVLMDRLANLQKYVEDEKRAIAPHLEKIGISVDDVVKFSLVLSALQQQDVAAKTEVKRLQDLFDPENAEGHMQKKSVFLQRIAEVQADLDEEQRRYQQYVSAKQEWQDRRAAIIGNQETPGTIEYLNRRRSEVSALPAELARLRNQRWELVRDILERKREFSEVLTDLHRPVQEFVERLRLGKLVPPLSFEVRLEPEGFIGRFLGFIDQGKKGAFRGVVDGSAALRAIMARSDFETVEGVQEFVDTVVSSLCGEEWEGDMHSALAHQLRADVAPNELYEYLFGLDYLVPTYGLRWDGTPVSLLSPGERGALLLVFYLLVDPSDVPLIIDQPEDNLDNQTVYEVLVRCIKQAKHRRQIIMVTHNPNLAVVCDADQVIYCEIDKKHGNRVTYESGSIENRSIRQHIVDVLEGTRPAFDNRRSKYDVP